MSADRFEVMLALSRVLTDEHIDDAMNEVEVPSGRSSRTVTNRTIRVRGKLEGRPLVVSVQDYYFPGDGITAVAPLRNILEVFVAGTYLTFEGECRRRDLFDTIGRWLGGGGLRGPHPLFDRLRIDGARGAPIDDFTRPEFCARIESLLGHPDCHRIQIQASTGINAIFRASNIVRSFSGLDGVVRDCAALAAA